MRAFQIVLVALIFTAVLYSGCQEDQKMPESAQTVVEEAKTTIETHQTEPQTTPGDPQGQDKPILELEDQVYDFGRVGPDDKYVCTIFFKNTGDGILKIKKIDATCSCTVPKLEKKEYAPGEKGQLQVVLHSDKRPGRMTKHLYIHSNDEKNPKHRFTIFATVKLNVSVEPDKVSLTLKEENAGMPAITLKSRDNKPFAIKNFSTLRAVMTADFDPSVEATAFLIQPKVNMEKLQRQLNGNIKIELTHPLCDEVNIRYSTIPLFKVSRPRIIIKDAKPGEKVIKEVWVKSNYNKNFEIESIHSINKHMEVIEQEPHGPSVKLQVQITIPPHSGKSRYFTDELIIKLADETRLGIKCSGWYPAQPK